MQTTELSRRKVPSARIHLRAPRRQDGADVWALVQGTAGLDDNSMYCNLLQCTHFAATCALAEIDGAVVGWVSGYIPPETPDVLFVWQVCVSEKARGQGLARRLIASVLARDVCSDVRVVHSTITEANKASWALFGSIADSLEADLNRQPHFERDDHFDGRHETEYLVSIGPFERAALPLRDAA
ncbi:diaminobutyrate acetyltransferase [Aurantimonas aggregata]|uniref:L-2,4-diaminobutyric acid acetyltransferase n=1 Tax=Aurantimonas aggregata TaxID=2047720 RepID=A0A6L9MG53_9HYPH|nr:diaminobutyrate acetyltransferase [Aurantimonas aggregata]NDV86777.1 diaminobutyrate acetyltransferase [Aurantimonas aggregata]